MQAQAKQNLPTNLRQPTQPNAVLASGQSPVQDVMQMNLAPQATAVPFYPPGAPMQPLAGLASPSGPRQYQYPVSVNNFSGPRAYEMTSFAELRNLALSYEGIQLCEQVWFDIVSRLIPRVTFKPNIIPDGEDASAPKWREIAEPAEEWLERPDGVLELHEWLTASVRDLLELGQSAIWIARNNIGEILGVELVDAALIKPLLDERGRQPRAPFPAYQEWLYGVPAGDYLADDLFVMRETTRTDSIYPFSRVERIVMRVNQALRKEVLDLARYTQGSTPEGMIIPPESSTWTPEEVELYEQTFNGLLAGQEEKRVQAKVLPPGSTWQNARNDSPELDFDRFLLNITVGAFGLTMDEVAFTDTSNRSVGQSQQNVIYRRVIEPIANRYRMFFTRIIQEKFDKRLVVQWGGMEEREDQKMKAELLKLGVEAAAISPSYMAHEMGWKVQSETPPFVVTRNGIEMLEDVMALRKAQLDAKLAGLQFAVSAPIPEAMPTLPPEPPGGPATPPQKPGPAHEDEKPTPQPKANVVAKTPDAKPAAKTPAPLQRHQASPAAISEDYRRWYTVAMRAVKRHQRVPAFTSSVLPPEDYALLASDLARCKTPDEVRSAFQRAREREQMQVVEGTLSRSTGHTSICLMFPLPSDAAEALAVEGGEPAEDLHLTLCMLGKADGYSEDDLAGLQNVIQAFASSHAPLVGRISGLGRFNAPQGEPEPMIALADVPGLAAFRQELVEVLDEAGVALDMTHDYTPHCTLAYVAPDVPNPVQSVPALPLMLGSLVLAVGDEAQTFILGVPEAARAASPALARADTAPKPLGKLTETQLARLTPPQGVTQAKQTLSQQAQAIFQERARAAYASLRQS